MAFANYPRHCFALWLAVFPAGLFGYWIDITERKQAEEESQKAHDELKFRVEERTAELKRSEEEKSIILNNMGQFVLYLDTNLIIQWANKTASESIGASQEELIGKSCYEVWHQRNSQCEGCPLEKIIETGKSQSTELTSPDGKRWLVQGYPVRDASGSIKGIIELTSDITELMQAQKDLEKSEKRYRTLFESAKDSIFIIDAEGPEAGKIVSANKAASITHGYTIDELLSLNIADLDTPDSAKLTKKRIQRILNGETLSAEVTHCRKDGTVFPVEIHANLLNLDGHQYILAFDINITKRKQTEEKIQQGLNKLRVAFEKTIGVLASALEKRDPYTTGHQERVANLARMIATEMNLSDQTIESIYLAGIIHDVGKIYVPAEILTKPTRLTENEFNLIKDHPKVAYDILKDIDFPWPVAEIAYQHHEKMNGSGYPRGLSGEDILLEARIMAVADVVEAMASHRPYRPALGIDAALDEISKNKGVSFDPDVVDACLRLFREKGFKLE